MPWFLAGNSIVLAISQKGASEQMQSETRVSSTRRIFIGLTLLATIGLAGAQMPPPDDFNPSGAGGRVYAMAIQLDGKILVGGAFSTLAGQTRNYIGRLSANGYLDSTYNPGADSIVCSLAIEADGQVLVGGSFTTLAAVTRTRIGRLNPDGSLDVSFAPNANNTVNAIAVHADGRILLGGSFTVVGGTTRNGIARLNADGTVESGFNPGVGGSAYSLVVQPDGKIVVGGNFTTLAGGSRGNLGRLNPDGTLDTSFAPNANGNVNALAVQPDGKILLGGSFTVVEGATRNGIARLNADGTLDTAFNPRVDNWGRVYSMVVQTDGKVVVGGSLTMSEEAPRAKLGRLNPDGTLDLSFAANASDIVTALAIQANGAILVGGDFGIIGGLPRLRLARLPATEMATSELSYDGATLTWQRAGTSPEVRGVTFSASTNGVDWLNLGAGQRAMGGWQRTDLSLPAETTFRALGFVNGGSGNGSSWPVQATIGLPFVTMQPQSCTNLPGTTAVLSIQAEGTQPIHYQWHRNGIAFSDDGAWSGATTSVLTVSNAFGSQGGDYLVTCSNAVGVVTSKVARLTVLDPMIVRHPTNLTSGLGQTASFSVTSLGTAPQYQWRHAGTNLEGRTTSTLTLANAQRADIGSYEVVVSNAFGAVTSSTAILGINLATADSFNPGAIPRSMGRVDALAVQTDGHCVLSGSYFGFPGRELRVARVNPDGTWDSEFGQGGNSDIFTLAVQPDGKIVVGGWFKTLGSENRISLGRLHPDGSLDIAFDPKATGGIAYPGVYSVAIQPDSKILVGGDFRSLGGQACTNLGRLNADGSLDSSFNAWADHIVYALAQQPDGRILVAGVFTNLSGNSCRQLGRVNPDGTFDNSFAASASDVPLCMAVQPDGQIVVGGAFRNLCGQTRNRIGRLNPDGTLDPSFNPDADGFVRTLALQADGSILAGGAFTNIAGQIRKYIARLKPDGSADPEFVPNADGVVYGLTAQPDGKILVGGDFRTLASVTRYKVGRLTNADPATEELAFDGHTVTWLRGGTSPEVWRTCFDFSTNGVAWFGGGPGHRVPGGWRLTGLDLPASATVRARGFVAGGRYGASTWFAESVLGPSVVESPAIVSQPSSRTNNATTVALLGVDATGTPPLTYRWYREGLALTNVGNISGVDKATLTLSNVSAALNGQYYVTASNMSGCVTSSAANLFVQDPFISRQPTSQTNPAATYAYFTATAGGSTSVACQWFKNGEALTNGGIISGATNTSLILNGVLGPNSGNYWLVVSNTFGVVTSAVASLTVLDPAITTQPSSQLVNAGSSTTLSVSSRGTNPNYQWYKDGIALTGETGLALTITNATWDDRGDYTFVVSNAYRCVTSSVAVLDVNLAAPDSFYPGAGGNLYALAVQPDGKVLAGGNFIGLAGYAIRHLGRLTPGGGLDLTFGWDAKGTVYCVAVQPDGKILVGGDQVGLGGVVRTNLGRLKADGGVDESFAPHPNGPVISMLLRSDDQVMIGGGFTTVSGEVRKRIALLTTSGAVVPEFAADADYDVTCLSRQPDGRILVGGAFTNLNGQMRPCLGRLELDGSLDGGYHPDVNGAVCCMAQQSDGKTVIGGEFTTIDGEPRCHIARLNLDGSLDPTFDPSLSESEEWLSIVSLVIQADGKIVLGSKVSTVAGETRKALARLNNDGSLDSTFNLPVGYNYNTGSVLALAAQKDGSLLVGGQFTKLARYARENIGRLTATEPAVESLRFDGTRVHWRRGGTCAQFWRTTFELSTNGVDWNVVGPGERTQADWCSAALTAPVNSLVRARGFLSGGQYNGSCWFEESLLSLNASTPPAIVTSPLGSTVPGEPFSFGIGGLIGQTIVVEASSNLADWLPLETNTIQSSPVFFSDPGSTNHPVQFYRARLVP